MANTQKQDNDVLQSKCKSCAIIITHIYSKQKCIYQEPVAEVIKHSLWCIFTVHENARTYR